MWLTRYDYCCLANMIHYYTYFTSLEEDLSFVCVWQWFFKIRCLRFCFDHSPFIIIGWLHLLKIMLWQCSVATNSNRRIERMEPKTWNYWTVNNSSNLFTKITAIHILLIPKYRNSAFTSLNYIYKNNKKILNESVSFTKKKGYDIVRINLWHTAVYDLFLFRFSPST